MHYKIWICIAKAVLNKIKVSVTKLKNSAVFSLHVFCAGALFWGQFSAVTDVRFISAPAPAFPWTHDHMTDSSTTSTNPQRGWAHRAGTGGAAGVPPTNIPSSSVTRYPRLQWTDPHTHTHTHTHTAWESQHPHTTSQDIFRFRH